MSPSDHRPKERPILFTGPLIEAILDGRKTETRRVAKNELDLLPGTPSPYGRAGDLLHVGETLVPIGYNGVEVASYQRDGALVIEDGQPVRWRWKVRSLSSMYCPKAYRRIWLWVLETRTERVQEIDEAGAQAEGWDLSNLELGEAYGGGKAVEWFAQLWDQINEKRGFPWSSNPLVRVVRFELASSTGRPA